MKIAGYTIPEVLDIICEHEIMGSLKDTLAYKRMLAEARLEDARKRATREQQEVARLEHELATLEDVA